MPPKESTIVVSVRSSPDVAIENDRVTQALPSNSGHVMIRQRVLIERGGWWFCDQRSGRNIPLDALLENCGWSVSELCEALQVSERTFARVVERSLGINPKDWLCRLRAVAACRLLREVGKVEPVANMLGFKHVADFSREFRRQTGVIPSIYLKSERSRMFHSPEVD